MNLINLIELYESEDKDIFANINLPKGLEKDLVVQTILDLSATFIPLYTDYRLFNQKNIAFFNRNYLNFARLLEAFNEEYNPIHNYDRYEERDENRNRENTENNNISIKNEGTQSPSQTQEKKVSAFDSSNYENQEKIELGGTNRESQSGNQQTNLNSNENESYTTDNHLYGNIGVTTSQQMLESEFVMREKWNLYEMIARKWFSEFMLRMEGESYGY